MRIVELVPSLDVGGAERLAALLAQGLTTLGHDVTVVSMFAATGSWIEAELRAAGIELRFLDKQPGLDLRMIGRLRRVLRDLQPDVVHTHLHTLKYAWPAVGFRGPAIVHTVHNLAEHEVETHTRAVHHVAFRLGVEPVAIGDAVAESLKRVYGRTPRSVIPNGIRVADFRSPAGTRERTRQALASQLGFEADTTLFFTAGRLNEQKNHAGLLDAFASPALASAHLLVAGEGALLGALQAQAAALGVASRVHFLGVRRDVSTLMAAADAFVLASNWEGNPLVVLEAMAAGLPVVATDVGCVAELVSHETGRVVPPGSPPALAAALAELAGDRALVRALGARGADIAAARFDVAVMARAYSELFATVADGPHRRGGAC
ncbi:glycosyl transferase family 1 [Deltaproteobacteria bacterium]|nr:glycosyl transferase family 1 [Deltaproteobacteria bacterium]